MPASEDPMSLKDKEEKTFTAVWNAAPWHGLLLSSYFFNSPQTYCGVGTRFKGLSYLAIERLSGRQPRRENSRFNTRIQWH
jgi:hypothetical protein